MIPARIVPLLTAPGWDPGLTEPELVAALDALLSEELDDPLAERLLAYLEVNLPGGEVAELVHWPGEWFGNRWYEEVALDPEEAAHHLLERCGRQLSEA